MKSIYTIAALFCLTSHVQAAQSVWILEETTAQWGTWGNGVDAGSSYGGPYTEYVPSTNSIAINNGILNNEGPVDGTAAIIGKGSGFTGTATYINTATSYNLANVNDSVTLIFAHHYMDKFASPASGYASNEFTMFEIGLSAATDPNLTYFGGANDDSFFFAGRNTTTGLTQGQTNGTFDLLTYDEDTISGTAPGDNIGIGTIIESDLTLNAAAISGGTPSTPAGGISYLYNLTLTNVGTNLAGDGIFQIDHVITEFAITGVSSSDTVTATGNVFSGSQDVEHGLSDLSSLNLGLGVRALDSGVPISGTNFDMNASYLAAIPEPSSLTLSLISMLGLLAYRKRTH